MCSVYLLSCLRKRAGEKKKRKLWKKPNCTHSAVESSQDYDSEEMEREQSIVSCLVKSRAPNPIPPPKVSFFFFLSSSFLTMSLGLFIAWKVPLRSPLSRQNEKKDHRAFLYWSVYATVVWSPPVPCSSLTNSKKKKKVIIIIKRKWSTSSTNP